MPSQKQALKCYVSEDEHATIVADAKRAGLSVSTYMARVCLGQPTPSLEKQSFRRDLMKAHADLGRLGGLFKLALSEKQGASVALQNEIRRILREIEFRQAEMKVAISRI